MYTVSDLKNDMIRKLHGTTLNKLTDVDGLIYEAARNVLSHVDPTETKAYMLLSTPLYDSIYDYQAPADLKGKKIIDIREQVGRRVRDDFTQIYNSEFDQYKHSRSDNRFTIEHRNGTKILRVQKRLTAAAVLSNCDTIDGNGTWAAVSPATNLTVDTLNKVSGNASLRFDSDGTGVAPYIENSTLTAIDGTNQLNQGALFLRVWLPDASTITSIDLRWGNDSLNFWNRTVTVTQEGASFNDGWNLLRIDWDGATETGTPDPSNLIYSRVTITQSALTAETDYRVDEITLQNGTLFDILYYSKYLFSDASTGAFQERVTDDTNIINLDTESYNLILYELTYLAAQQVQGEDSALDIDFYKNEKDGYYMRYSAANPSEIKKPRATYYRMPRVQRRRGSDGPTAVNEGTA